MAKMAWKEFYRQGKSRCINYKSLPLEALELRITTKLRQVIQPVFTLFGVPIDNYSNTILSVGDAFGFIIRLNEAISNKKGRLRDLQCE